MKKKRFVDISFAKLKQLSDARINNKELPTCRSTSS